MSKFRKLSEERSPREVVITWATDSGSVITATLTRSAFFTTKWDAIVTRWDGREAADVASFGGMGTSKSEARRWAEGRAKRMQAHKDVDS